MSKKTKKGEKEEEEKLLIQQGKRPKMKEKIKPKIETTLNVVMAMVWC